MRKTILGSLKAPWLERRGCLLLSECSVSRRSPQPTRWARSTSSPMTPPAPSTASRAGRRPAPTTSTVAQTDRFGFGKALRISNAVTSGAFGDQTFSPGLTEPAGETARKHFEASFKIANDVE